MTTSSLTVGTGEAIYTGTDCPACDGTGQVTDPADPETTVDCLRCEGDGCGCRWRRTSPDRNAP